MQTLAIFGLVGVAFALYAIWGALERRRSRAAAAVHEDVHALGDDAVPGSLHPQVDTHLCIGSGACTRACPEHDVIGLVDGRVRLVNPLACVGHGACMAACPVQAITLVFGTARRGVELPQVDPTFQSNLDGVYIAGELGGMGLIRNAVEQGRQAAEAIVAQGRRGRGGALDAVVVGAGPAGISATLHLLQAGLRVELLEQGAYGGTIMHYPRAKVVMTGALDLPVVGRIKRRTMNKEALVELWEDIRTRANLPVREGVRVEGLEGDGATWTIKSADAAWRAANVVLALGRRGSPKKLGVPGEDQVHVYDRLIEPAPFAGQDVLVVGGGNAAAESAIALAEHEKVHSVALSYRRRELARLRSQVRDRLYKLVEIRRITLHVPTQVVEIHPEDVVLKHVETGATSTVPADSVIVQIGGTAPAELLARFGIMTVIKRGEA